MPLGVLVAVCGVALAWLALGAAAPYGDSGGYEVMLRHFLASGRVDYMKWSQPTFIGVLPVAVPWAWAFGASTASLQWLSVAFALALLGGVWVFCARGVGGWGAFWLALGVMLLHEALSSSVAFVTDVPYAAYMVGFLCAHRALEALYSSGRRSGARWLWVAWGVLFLLSALTRSFSLVLVLVFAAQWAAWRGDARRGAFALRCLLLGLGLSVASLGVTRVLGANGFSPSEITAVPLILGGDTARLNLRALASGVLGLAVATLPGMLLWAPGTRSKVTKADAASALAALGLGAALWKKGALDGLFSLPQAPGVEKAALIAQVALGVVALPLAIRLLVAACKYLRARETSVADVDAASPHTAGVLVAIVLVHLALMPILLHPLPRHLMPAGIAILMLVSLLSRASSNEGVTLPRAASYALTVTILPLIVLGLAGERALSQKQFEVADGLRRKGVPASQIDGGWAFFCARNLRPGLPAKAHEAPNDYVSRFARLQAKAPLSVAMDGAARGQRLSSNTVRLPLGPQRTILAVRRSPRPSAKAPRAKQASKPVNRGGRAARRSSR